MSKSNFELIAYVPYIQRIAEKNAVSPQVALQCFISNLTCMKEHYEGADTLNYHELGQQWNNLLSKEKVAQKAEVEKRLLTHRRSGAKE